MIMIAEILERHIPGSRFTDALDGRYHLLPDEIIWRSSGLDEARHNLAIRGADMLTQGATDLVGDIRTPTRQPMDIARFVEREIEYYLHPPQFRAPFAGSDWDDAWRSGPGARAG